MATSYYCYCLSKVRLLTAAHVPIQSRLELLCEQSQMAFSMEISARFRVVKGNVDTDPPQLGPKGSIIEDPITAF